MAKRKLDAPYEELGKIIVGWRKTRHRSALALYKEQKLSFSYSTYVDYERGVSLPRVEDLVEIALAFSQDASEAVRLWAMVQMPTPELREVFRIDRRLEKNRKAEAPKTREAQPDFETTWVFGPNDYQLFVANPWLWDVILLLCTTFPEELPYARLKGGKEVAKNLNQTIRHWLDSGYVIASDTGIRLRLPNVYVPNTPDWFALRNQNIERALHGIFADLTEEKLRKKDAFRDSINCTLSPAQLELWVDKLRELGADFRASTESFPATLGTDNLYALVMVLGKRKIGEVVPRIQTKKNVG